MLAQLGTAKPLALAEVDSRIFARYVLVAKAGRVLSSPTEIQGRSVGSTAKTSRDSRLCSHECHDSRLGISLLTVDP